jgi:outer membrane protein OmpA-like peptidoglycan-associated protein
MCNKMKIKNLFIVSILSICLIFSGCETVKENKSAAIGGGIGVAGGTAVGYGLGKLLGNSTLGAVIGGVVGGTAGTLIGHKMDKQRKELAQIEGVKVEAINNGEATRVTFDSGILFATGKHELNAASKTSLTQFATNLVSNPDTHVGVVGHTDNTGTDKVNIPLSVERANEVKTFLINHGVVSDRIESTGKGSSEPIADNATKTGQAQNRRVEVFLLPNEQMIQSAQQGTLK